MQWSVTQGEPAGIAGDLLVVPVAEDKRGPNLKAVLALIGDDGHLAKVIRRGGFRGKVGTTLPVNDARFKAGWLLLTGVGPADEISLDGLRRAAGTAALQARSMQARTVLVMPLAVDGGFDAQTVVRCWVEGAEMGLAPAGPADAARLAEQGPRRWKIVTGRGGDGPELQQGLQEGQIHAAGCLEARRLVNLPPNQLTPRALADYTADLARDLGLKCTVLGPPQMRRQKLNGILGVGQGSRNEPRLICLESRGAARGVPTVALVGKGITFDTGGISLKPGAKMDVMKCDMAGAAAVVNAAMIVTRRELPVRLLAVVPAAENMPDGQAIRPSDVLEMAAGKTVEVVNTDAEGRLILADALHWVCTRRPDYVIDIATLTGACLMALGPDFAGVMGTSSELMQVLEQAGGETGERVWPLPLIDAHRETLQSKVADLKNLGPREGSAMTAAAFLSYFVPQDIAWAHVDIAGPAWTEKDGPLGPRGGTGFGARLLARTVELLVS
jgi:leucyl aminopeptidase